MCGLRGTGRALPRVGLGSTLADAARLRACTPVIPVRDIHESLAFYQDKLGFTKLFDDAQWQPDGITYAGIIRDDIALHLQATVEGQDEAAPVVRIRVANIERLHAEYDAAGVVAESGPLTVKPWGSREFGVYDPNRAALVFFETIAL